MNKSAVQQPLSTTAISSRLTRVSAGSALYNHEPLFEFLPWENTTTTFRVRGLRNPNGNRVIVLPFQRYSSPADTIETIYELVTDEWTLNLTSTAIDFPSSTGGIVDGSTKVAGDWYLLWGFTDPTATNGAAGNKFKGLALTRRPFASYTSVTGGTKGSSAKFTVAGAGNNDGRFFNVGARVIAREDNAGQVGASTSEYNQGTITAVGSTSITVDLDSGAYGTNLTVAGEIFQTDNMAPKVAATDAVYGGYDYCYLGAVRLDSSLQVEYLRKQGDWLPDGNGVTGFVYAQTDAVTSTVSVYLAQWMPVGATEASLHMRAIVTAVVGSVDIGIGLQNTYPIRCVTLPSTVREHQSNRVYIDPTDAHYDINLSAGGSTVQRAVYYDGYRERNW